MFNILKQETREIEKQRFTVIQAAKHLKLTRDAVYKKIKAGKLKSHQYLGRTCLYVEDCVIVTPPSKLGFKSKRRRTKDQIRKDNIAKSKRKYARKRKRIKLAALPPEERDRIIRQKTNKVKQRCRRRKAALRKKELLQAT